MKISDELRKRIQDLEFPDDIDLIVWLPIHYLIEIRNWIMNMQLGAKFDDEPYYKASVIMRTKSNVMKYYRIYPIKFSLTEKNNIEVTFRINE
jgi:hypothetical protein